MKMICDGCRFRNSQNGWEASVKVFRLDGRLTWSFLDVDELHRIWNIVPSSELSQFYNWMHNQVAAYVRIVDSLDPSLLPKY